MSNEPERIVRELLARLTKDVDPCIYSVGERLITTDDIRAVIFFDWGMASGTCEVVIPKGTLAEYRGGSPYSSFTLALSEEVHKALGPSIFRKDRDQWLIPLPPSAYSIEIIDSAATKNFQRAG